MSRILVILPNWYGETLFATPFLRALRRLRPDDHLAALGWPACREVLQHNPDVDELLDYEEQGRHRGLRGAWRLVRSLRGGRFETAFILRRSLSRTTLLALAGIPERIGFANAKSGWLLTHRVRPPSPSLHKAATYLPLLSAIGGSASLEPYRYTVTEAEREDAKVLLRGAGVRDDRPFIVLHPGANWFHKRWPPERFAMLGDRLSEQPGAQIVWTGGPQDGALIDGLRRAMRHPAIGLAGGTTFRQLAACLERAQAVVAGDTGVLHLAAALGRSVVALYGPTSPALTGPLGESRRTVVLHHPGCCPAIPCYRPDRPVHAGMRSLTVDEVHAAVCSLLHS